MKNLKKNKEKRDIWMKNDKEESLDFNVLPQREVF
jgi:hypothetical protein